MCLFGVAMKFDIYSCLTSWIGPYISIILIHYHRHRPAHVPTPNDPRVMCASAKRARFVSQRRQMRPPSKFSQSSCGVKGSSGYAYVVCMCESACMHASTVTVWDFCFQRNNKHNETSNLFDGTHTHTKKNRINNMYTNMCGAVRASNAHQTYLCKCTICYESLMECCFVRCVCDGFSSQQFVTMHTTTTKQRRN